MINRYLYKTKIGDIIIEDNGDAITGLYFTGEADLDDCNVVETPLLKETSKQLIEYFDGKRKTFQLPLAPKGTEFQKKVWDALIQIPWGETRSYKEIAHMIGNDKASRAVGMSNNKNPIAIIIPCHRVIGANGKLVGYAGGLHIKKMLLELEEIKILG